MPVAPRPLHVETVLEPVEVETGRFDAAAMARGEPGIPRRFLWRGRTYDVVEVLGPADREVGPCHSGSDETYVRRHVTRARTACGAIVTLSGERGGRRGAAPRWILRQIERPAS